MSSAADRPSLRNRFAATLAHNVPSIATGVVVAMPVAYGAQSWTGSAAASFFVLILSAVSVPGLIDRFAPASETKSAVAWTIVACLVDLSAYFGLFLALDALVAGPVAAAIAFIVVSLGAPALLATLTGR